MTTTENKNAEIFRVYYFAECCKLTGRLAGHITGDDIARIDAIERDDDRDDELELLGVSAPSDCHYIQGNLAEILHKGVLGRDTGTTSYERKVGHALINFTLYRRIKVGGWLKNFISWLESDGWDVDTDEATAVYVDGKRIDDQLAKDIAMSLYKQFCKEQ